MPTSNELLQTIIRDIQKLNTQAPHKIPTLLAYVAGISEGTIQKPNP